MMLELAMQMLFCLLISALLGGIIGYILGRMRRCDKQHDAATPLYDYDEMQQQNNAPHKEVFASFPTNDKNTIEQGIKPISLDAPKDGIADDLKEISGIGIKVENSLYELGIYHFSQIAEWTPDNVSWIDAFLSYQGRVEREDWIEQAKQLSVGSRHHNT